MPQKYIDNFYLGTKHSGIGLICSQYTLFAFFWPLLMLGPPSGSEFSPGPGQTDYFFFSNIYLLLLRAPLFYSMSIM